MTENKYGEAYQTYSSATEINDNHNAVQPISLSYNKRKWDHYLAGRSYPLLIFAIPVRQPPCIISRRHTMNESLSCCIDTTNFSLETDIWICNGSIPMLHILLREQVQLQHANQDCSAIHLSSVGQQETCNISTRKDLKSSLWSKFPQHVLL